MNRDIFPRHLLDRFRDEYIERAIEEERQKFARELESDEVRV